MVQSTISIKKTPELGNWANVSQTLTLKAEHVDHKIVNKLEKVPIAKSSNTKADEDPEFLYIDLKIIEEAFNIEGRLLNEMDTSTTATLNGAHNSSTTTITVDDTTDFEAYGAIQIGDEIIEYTSKTSTTFTVSTRGRGYAGTTAASHSDTDTVYKCNTAVHQKQKIRDFINTGKSLSEFKWKDETFNNSTGGVYLESALFNDEYFASGDAKEGEVMYHYGLTIIVGKVRGDNA